MSERTVSARHRSVIGVVVGIDRRTSTPFQGSRSPQSGQNSKLPSQGRSVSHSGHVATEWPVSRSETVIEPGDESSPEEPDGDGDGTWEDEIATVDDRPDTADVEVVSVAGEGETRAAIAIPGADRVVAIGETATLGRPDAAEQPDVPLPITDTEVVEGDHAAVTTDGNVWRVVDRSTAGTHVEVADGEWSLLLSEEGLAFHRDAGFDRDRSPFEQFLT